ASFVGYSWHLLRQSGHRRRAAESPTLSAAFAPLAAPDTQNIPHTSLLPNAAVPAASAARSPLPRAWSGCAWPHPQSRSSAPAGLGGSRSLALAIGHHVMCLTRASAIVPNWQHHHNGVHYSQEGGHPW